MAELTASDGAQVLERLEAVAPWLNLVSTWLAEAGSELEAIGLVDAARQDIAAVCRWLERGA
jgi:hypothetical protein